MLDIYIRTFTDKEIDGMLAFYRWTTGAAVITK